MKTANPEQELRFDVPTVGAGTLRTIADAGGRWLVVEAERTILLDRGEFAAEADRLGVRVIAVDPAVIEREIAA